MPETKVAVDSSATLRSARSGVIELLQVFSLLALAAAWLLHKAPGHTIFLWALIAVGTALFILPFVLLPPLEKQPHRYPEGPHGFRITCERRRTLAELSVPDDILQAIDESLLGNYYETGKDLREALYVVLGEPRVRPWADMILLHAQVYVGRSTQPAYIVALD